MIALVNAAIAGVFAVTFGPAAAIGNGLLAIVFAILSLKERP